MITLFDKAFNITVGIEGGYVNDPDDRGGETKYGISKRSYPDLDIENLTLYEAKEIYYKDYWNTPRGDLGLLPKKLALEIFDTGVNMGVSKARKMFQEALNLLNRVETKYPDLKVDGFIGTKTFSVVPLVQEKKLLKVLNGLQFCTYLEIVEDTHNQEKFFAGWIERT